MLYSISDTYQTFGKVLHCLEIYHQWLVGGPGLGTNGINWIIIRTILIAYVSAVTSPKRLFRSSPPDNSPILPGHNHPSSSAIIATNNQINGCSPRDITTPVGKLWYWGQSYPRYNNRSPHLDDDEILAEITKNKMTHMHIFRFQSKSLFLSSNYN